jgi:hypothetical protein
VPGEGEAVDEGGIALLEGFGDTVRNDHRTERGVPGGQALGAGDDVGHVVVLLTTEPGAKTTEGADHFVGDEQDAVAVTDATHFGEVARRRREATTGILHRF